jgi:tRNA (guanine9-N1)-methyltransferase
MKYGKHNKTNLQIKITK